jgi:glucose-6-phosphate isomerase
VTSGDYLSSFLLGTRNAFSENGRQSISITIKEVSPATVGCLIALFERVVGYYASFVNVNAYHQPGVEAGKKAAAIVIATELAIVKFLSSDKQPHTADEIAAKLGDAHNPETIFKICERLAANPLRKLKKTPGQNPFAAQYSMS